MSAVELDLLVVDEDASLAELLARRFRQRGMHVDAVASSDTALTLAEQRQFDVAIVSLDASCDAGLALLEQLKTLQPECEVLAFAARISPEVAVQALKKGAADYVLKTTAIDDLEMLVRKANARRQLIKENRQLKSLLARAAAPRRMIGDSPAMQTLARAIDAAALSDQPVLIHGEPGAGKRLVAELLHAQSGRAEHPFVVVSAAALPAADAESELFGDAAKPGLFEIADGGALFIDEIAALSLAQQAKLLHVLHDGLLCRLGSVKERRVHVRLVASTCRNLAEEVAAGRFLADLAARLRVLTLEAPPLRDRPGDVRLLAEHFLGEGWSLEPDALQRLEAFGWPGNVKQLAHTLERAKLLAHGRTIRVTDLPAEIATAASTVVPLGFTFDNLAALERTKVVEVLGRERGNKTRAARVLGIDRRKLYRLLDKYALGLSGHAHSTNGHAVLQ